MGGCLLSDHQIDAVDLAEPFQTRGEVYRSPSSE
jgi:hypothetical protein